MNWVDILLIVLLVVAGFIGWRMGLVRTIVSIAAVIIGMNVSSRIAQPIADALTDTVGSASIASVAAYVIIGVVIFIIAQIVGMMLTKLLKLIFLGWANTLAGLGLGLIAGFLAGLVAIAILARLAMPAAGSSLVDAATAQSRESVKNTLVESAMVPAYLDGYKAIRARYLGITSGEFEKALQALQAEVDAK